MKKSIKIILAAFVCLVATGCGKEAPTQERVQYLRLETASVSAPSAGGSYTVNVVTNTACKVSTGEIDWVVVADDSFVGNKSLKLDVLENGGSSRSGVITISTRDDSISCELKVNQN